MKNLLFTPEKLTAYSCVAAALLSSKKTEAQIQYTDLSPDLVSVLNVNTNPVETPLDFNNDGITDLTIHHYHYEYYSFLISDLDVEDNLRIAAFSYFPGVHVLPLNEGATIDGELRFYPGGILRSPFVTGDWGIKEKYFGFRLRSHGNYYYGWARLQIPAYRGDSIFVRDYAINITPGEAIGAGQTSPCGDGYENNNNFALARQLKSNAIYYALIQSSGDKDFFKINVTDENLRVTLFNLPNNYKLALYDSTHQLLAVSQHPGLADEQIVYNAIPAGIYYVKVAAGNNLFDPDDCYALQIESGTSPYRVMSSESSINESEKISIYPNPATSHVLIEATQGILSEVRIIDLTGRNLKVFHADVDEDQMTIDLSDLNSGTYLLQIFEQDDVAVKKLIVQK